MNTATIKLTSRRGSVAFAEIKRGNATLYQSRTWGDAFCAVRECREWAAANGVAIKEVK